MSVSRVQGAWKKDLLLIKIQKSQHHLLGSTGRVDITRTRCYLLLPYDLACAVENCCSMPGSLAPRHHEQSSALALAASRLREALRRQPGIKVIKPTSLRRWPIPMAVGPASRLGCQSPGIKQRLSPHLTPSTRAPQVLSSTRAPAFTHTRASHAHARHRRATRVRRVNYMFDCSAWPRPTRPPGASGPRHTN